MRRLVNLSGGSIRVMDEDSPANRMILISRFGAVTPPARFTDHSSVTSIPRRSSEGRRGDEDMVLFHIAPVVSGEGSYKENQPGGEKKKYHQTFEQDGHYSTPPIN